MERLRLETRPLHDRVERAVDLPSRCASIDAYSDLLRRMLALHEPLEERLSRLDPGCTGIDFGGRRKAHLLRADLCALGSPVVEEALPCQALPLVATPAAAVGCLYVLEGATLGGRVIARALRETLGLTETGGGRFFAGYGERTGAMWRAFGDAANAYCGEDEGKMATAFVTATKTFEAFEAGLKGPYRPG